jgi:hypothetical protein
MRELWVGLVELLTSPSEFGDTRCFTNALLWAQSREDYGTTLASFLEPEGMSLLDVQWCHPVAEYEEVPEEMVRFIEWAKQNPDDWTTADRHYYPSKPA